MKLTVVLFCHLAFVGFTMVCAGPFGMKDSEGEKLCLEEVGLSSIDDLRKLFESQDDDAAQKRGAFAACRMRRDGVMVDKKISVTGACESLNAREHLTQAMKDMMCKKAEECAQTVENEEEEWAVADKFMKCVMPHPHMHPGGFNNNAE